MRVSIICIGRMKSGSERELVERYQLRAKLLGKALGFTGFDVIELTESRARREVDRQTEEMSAILAKADKAQFLLFDERYPSPSSQDFASKLEKWKDSGTNHVVCILGGPDGVASDLRQRAHWGVSFGQLSLPHQLARVLVSEQLYRAMTLLAGHPYHRSGQD